MNAEALGRLATRQHGLFTAGQGRGLGLTAKQIEGGARTGLWTRLHRGVYVVRGVPVSDLQSLHAAVLASGAGAMASHRGAAWLWGLTSGLRLETGGPSQRRPAGRIAYRRLQADVRPVVRRGIPATNPLVTLLHLAATGDEGAVVAALDRGIANRLFTAAAVEAELGRRAARGVRGVLLLRDVLGRRLDAEGEHPSALESAMDRVVVSRPFPLPDRQHWVAGTRYRLDYAWPAARLAVEVDGYEDHSGLEAFGYDRRRQNVLVLAGWTVLRFTWADVRDRPGSVATQIGRALAGVAHSV